MLRRKLALYTLFYIAGIAAGFFVFEKSRVAEAAGFCAAAFAAIIFTDMSDAYRPYRIDTPQNSSGYIYKHLKIQDQILRRQKALLAIMILAGFAVFSFRYLSYSDAMSYVHNKNYIRGKVVSVSAKDDKIRLTVKNIEAGPAKVLITLDATASERSGLKTGSSVIQEGCFEWIGTTVEARGEYTEIASADNPGCFDYSLYMKCKGVTTGFRAYIFELTDSRVSLITEARRYLYSTRESFISRFDDETRGFIRGVIFGDKSGMDDVILEEFKNNSTGHILAVSGLHIGFLYGLLRLLTARKRTLPVSALIVTVILLYGGMTMWSAATIRACIVMTISLCSAHFRRSSDLLTSVSLAAFLILTFQPYQLFNSGFQLSFMAMCGIAFFTKPIASVTGEAIAVMLSVQLGTLPVIAYSFCRINPLSMLINIPVILLASVLVPLCILMLIFELAVSRVPSAGIDLAELISYAVIKINHLLGFGGSFSVRTAGPGAAASVAAYIFLFALASEWTRVTLLRKHPRRLLKQAVLLLMPPLMLFSCLYDTISDDEIVFVAVGQGDCVHIRTEDRNVLIDGGGQAGFENSAGGDNDSEPDADGYSEGYNVGKNILMPYLMHSGADAVDMALVTHMHTDHYKGIAELAGVFPVGAVGVPADYRGVFADAAPNSNGAEDKAVKGSFDQIHQAFLINPNSKLNIEDDVYIDVIWPVKLSEEPISADDPNEHNTVYMIHYKGIKVMVTGDLLEEDEREMVDHYRGTETLKCDILKVAHHGSKSSSSEEFLDAASPRIAVIQCGRNNFYGHPHKQTLERLEERGIPVFRTDINGAVGIDIHRERMSVDLFK